MGVALPEVHGAPQQRVLHHGARVEVLFVVVGGGGVAAGSSRRGRGGSGRVAARRRHGGGRKVDGGGARGLCGAAVHALVVAVRGAAGGKEGHAAGGAAVGVGVELAGDEHGGVGERVRDALLREDQVVEQRGARLPGVVVCLGLVLPGPPSAALDHLVKVPQGGAAAAGVAADAEQVHVRELVAREHRTRLAGHFEEPAGDVDVAARAAAVEVQHGEVVRALGAALVRGLFEVVERLLPVRLWRLRRGAGGRRRWG
mmetsp:Transcript_5049/g.15959  ORF Transcript_5049/g.15959 Transcript_5049/m.15959 type:complete len:257 (-) Transcript_5049:1148-1918(-)